MVRFIYNLAFLFFWRFSFLIKNLAAKYIYKKKHTLANKFNDRQHHI